MADARAPTPTGAAQIACPDREDLLQHTSSLHGRVERVIHRGIERRMQEIDILARRLIHPGEQIRNQFIHLQHLQERLIGSWTRSSEGSRWRLRDLVQRFTASRPDISRLIDHQNELSLRLQRSVSHRDESLTMILNRLHSHLSHLNPQSVLERGTASPTRRMARSSVIPIRPRSVIRSRSRSVGAGSSQSSQTPANRSAESIGNPDKIASGVAPKTQCSSFRSIHPIT